MRAKGSVYTRTSVQRQPQACPGRHNPRSRPVWGGWDSNPRPTDYEPARRQFTTVRDRSDQGIRTLPVDGERWRTATMPWRPGVSVMLAGSAQPGADCTASAQPPRCSRRPGRPGGLALLTMPLQLQFPHMSM